MKDDKKGKIQSRNATLEDAAALTRIYNEGIEDRIGTFETRPRTTEDIKSWFDGKHPIIVVENEGGIVAFASTSTYRSRDCYAGITEHSVYVARSERGKGLGQIALQALIEAAEKAGYWKLISRIFVENEVSLALHRKVGFREVGTYIKHGKLDGVWRDVVIVEYLITSNL